MNICEQVSLPTHTPQLSQTWSHMETCRWGCATRSLIYKSCINSDHYRIPGDTGEQAAAVTLSCSLVSICENALTGFLFYTGCEEKMNVLQVISLTLLSIVTAKAQVINPGRCPVPAVQEKFDAAQVNFKPYYASFAFVCVFFLYL